MALPRERGKKYRKFAKKISWAAATHGRKLIRNFMQRAHNILFIIEIEGELV